MLALANEDFGAPPEGGKSGATVWWAKLEGRKRTTLCLQWPELILVNPHVEFPECLRESSLEGWGHSSQVVAWVPGLARFLVRTDVPIPSVSDLVGLRRRNYPKARVMRSVFHWAQRLRFRELAVANPEPKRDLWLPQRSLKRIVGALGAKSHHDLDLRVVDPPWAPGSPLVVAYRNDEVRAAATAVSRRTLERTFQARQ